MSNNFHIIGQNLLSGLISAEPVQYRAIKTKFWVCTERQTMTQTVTVFMTIVQILTGLGWLEDIVYFHHGNWRLFVSLKIGN